MKRRIRFDTSTAALYPIMLTAFRNGGHELSAGNPANGGRDRRTGESGAAVVRSERAVRRALYAIGIEREWTEDEEVSLITDFEKTRGRAPSEAEIAAVEKPMELAPLECDRTADVVLSQSDYERLVAYCDAARWIPGFDQAVDMLDLIARADRVDE